MTDRELLEKAARASGIDVLPHLSAAGQWVDGKSNFYTVNGNKKWNPLTDDGDALRLAVKLYLWEAVRLAHREVSADVDIYAATRRAIVIAAAAIADEKNPPTR